MMECSNLSFKYEESLPFLIENFSINISKKERIFVIGKNGKGKSTLLKLIANELNPLTGEIKYHPNLKIGYFAQTNTAYLNPDNNILEEIMTSNSSCNMQEARNVCGKFLFKQDTALKKIAILSGGEKCRVLLSKLLINPYHLLILDEPTNHLDLESCEALLEALEHFSGSIIVVTHNELFLKKLSKKLIVFDKNKISIYEKKYQEFLDEIGWDDENNKENLKLSNNIPSLNKKEIKKNRAKFIQERSNLLKPIEEQINKLENEITLLESKKNEITNLIIDFSKSGNGKKIAKLTIEDKELTKQIEILYEKLDNEYSKREKIKDKYQIF